MAERPTLAISWPSAIWKVISTPWAIYGLLDRTAKIDDKLDQLREKVESLAERQSYLEGQIEHLLPHIDTKIRLAVMEATKDSDKL
jgi:hypothetical protein